MSALLDLDLRLFVLLNQEWTHPVLDAVLPIVTDFDYWRVPVILLLLAFLGRGSTETRIGILFAILSVVAADQIVSSGIKPIVARVRPFHVVAGTRKLVGAHDYSFPSAHAANVFAAGTFLALRFRRWRPVLILSALVAYSRVYVGVHYPSDVLAGAGLGAGIGFTLTAVERASRWRLEGLFVAWRRRRKPADGAPGDGKDAPGDGEDDPSPPAS